MTVLNFSYAAVKNPKKFDEYIKNAARLMEQFGVQVVARGKFVECTKGEMGDHQVAAVFRYKDHHAVSEFYNSPEYQKIIPLRDEACDMTITIYEE